MVAKIYLIGNIIKKLPQSKLPSAKEVMSLFFYHHSSESLTIKQSALITINCVFEVWSQAEIPTCAKNSAVRKLIYYHTCWKKLIKNRKNKKSTAQKQKQSFFCTKLDKLFDVAHHKVMKMIDKDKKFFLEGQRQSLRRGLIKINLECSMEVDICETNAPDVDIDDAGLLTYQTVSTISGNSEMISDFEEDFVLSTQHKLDIMTPDLAGALDRANVSSRNATYIIASTLTSAGINVEKYNLSHLTIHRSRENYRRNIVADLREKSETSKCVLHWDGKLMPDLVENKNVDRLPIILSMLGKEKFLGAPKIDSGTGENQATAVIETLRQWNETNNIHAMCFDTTPTNTGTRQFIFLIRNGACTLIEQALGRELFYFPCRHHISELLLRSVFETYWPTSSGPNVLIFNRFKNNWHNIDQQKYEAGMLDEGVSQILIDVKDQTLMFISNYLQVSQPRNDYNEFLQLASIFLNGTSADKVTFKPPGALHHARWMAKAIYSLKIFIFRKQFKMTKTELVGLRQICIFIIKFYHLTFSTKTSVFGQLLTATKKVINFSMSLK